MAICLFTFAVVVAFIGWAVVAGGTMDDADEKWDEWERHHGE